LKKLITIPRLLLFIILLFIILHVTPSLSLRTHLFLTGHPKLAFTTEIKELSKNDDNKGIRFFSFNPAPIHKATGNNMLAYKTTRIGFIYITTYHGGG
jgi:hypothetical protein